MNTIRGECTILYYKFFKKHIEQIRETNNLGKYAKWQLNIQSSREKLKGVSVQSPGMLLMMSESPKEF